MKPLLTDKDFSDCMLGEREVLVYFDAHKDAEGKIQKMEEDIVKVEGGYYVRGVCRFYEK